MYRPAKERYPDLPPEIQEKMDRWQCRLLTDKEKQRFLKALATNMIVEDIYKKFKLERHNVFLTREVDPKFDQDILHIMDERKHRWFTELERMASGRSKSTKVVKRACLDDDGRPILDEKGKQTFYTERIEITHHEPNAALLMFQLRAMFPEVYGKNAIEQAAQEQLPMEAIKAEAVKLITKVE